jgi:hypothetical protein
MQPSDCLDHVGAVACFADHFDVGVRSQRAYQFLPRQLDIVDNENTHRQRQEW